MTTGTEHPRELAVSIVGLGKLGAPIAACIAASGIRTFGADIDEQVVRSINCSIPPVRETGLSDKLFEARSMLTATINTGWAVSQSNLTVVLTPTPSKLSGEFSLEYILPVCEDIGRALSVIDRWHLVEIMSTVTPGDCEDSIKAVLEKSSGKRCPDDFGLCYSPEFVALGTVIRDFLDPDFVLIGEIDERSGQFVEEVYSKVYENDPPYIRMDLVDAELTKLALNAFMTTKITYANLLAKLCELLPGADVDVVTQALGFDSRIAPKYFKGALGYGGPCFPRDSVALAALARRLGIDPGLPREVDRLNRAEPARVVELVRGKLSEGDRVGVLGLTYKPGTSVTEESQALAIARGLVVSGHEVIAFDPMGMDAAREDLLGVDFASSVCQLVERSQVIVLAVPWLEFKQLEDMSLKDKVIIDCWRMLDVDKIDAEYVAIGRFHE